jgi:nucleotide-binding universal stress UspA family protein
MKGVRKILIAVNGDKEVLMQGLRLGGDEKCWVTVIKVLPPYEGDLHLTGVRDIEDVLTSGAAAEAAEIDGIAGAEKAPVRTRIEYGEAHERIVETAREERCDVIVMGARKDSLVRRFLGDRTVEKVIRNAPCPVLVLGTQEG